MTEQERAKRRTERRAAALQRRDEDTAFDQRVAAFYGRKGIKHEPAR